MAAALDVPMMVVFLDMDGVLNNRESMVLVQHGKFPPMCKFRHHTVNPACVMRLKKVVEELDLKLVISSVWRYIPGEAYKAIQWAGWVRPPIIGSTPRKDSKRGNEIKIWLAENCSLPVTAYAAVDDDVSDIIPYGIRVVKCESESGFQDKHAEELRALFT